MTKQRLYPYPRIAAKNLEWGEWMLKINGNLVAEDLLADEWDANSELILGISVQAERDSISDLGVDSPKLALTATCPSTAYADYADSAFLLDQGSMTATVGLKVVGGDVSQLLLVQPEIIGVDRAEQWLDRRILAKGPSLRIPLDTELDGFPTSSYSFDQRGLPEAPWRLIISADELEATFAHSVRLELNEDYASVRKLIKGNPDPHLARELDAAIVRVLIATASRLSTGSNEGRSPDDVAGEFPDSIAAAAKRASEQYLQLSLSAAVRSYRLTPEKHEYEVATGTRLLKD